MKVFLHPDFIVIATFRLQETRPVVGTLKKARMKLTVGVEPQSYSLGIWPMSGIKL